ncbi:MAG: phosphoribosylformylglycinamidine cyclo-ligase [Pegethrix bostrychoides GSE-TBD4-15B]|jgi:phosphoribosylformylglycinamidine cyclo-ligase|uniref:Phosphoribosylformylglycinamidine cyclo-ligase n=1 Tax=Pegethrix bostrychoides GSE-TBD4-15B TaxID=2839662 RepID=A0A951U6J0_9CYAN|nr:phosphoribosylformylglycinamidine cyclo-ligase [Pegethrix bostrychoides GSE-TBD4-15B]
MDYRQAGVDVEAGRAFVQQIRSAVESTYRPEVLGNFGGFGGCFELPAGYRQPVLVSGTDGVGTKLKLAHDCQQHDTVGIDLVAMCVNDVLTSGAEPLFFLDYLATGRLEPDQLAQVVTGIAVGCQQAGCALIGGETAEMPGFYQAGEYDLAGFCVGIVEKSQILSGAQVQLGDIAVGLASSGIHSNGYSLVRKIVEQAGLPLSDRPAELGGQTLAELLLTPTQIYVKPVLTALRAGLEIHGMAHITGGGLPENLPRCLGEAQSIRVRPAWPIPAIFSWLAAQGEVALPEMYSTFNMGIGYVLILPPAQVEPLIAQFAAESIAAYPIGEVIAGDGELVWEG